MAGGYDSGYESCPCFWGREPGSFVKRFAALLPSMHGLRALDVGCGEAKNAAYLAGLGCSVVALDLSWPALMNARRAWPDSPIALIAADARALPLKPEAHFDVVIAYGTLHCLPAYSDVTATVAEIQRRTVQGGYNIVCAFNARDHDFSGHPGFDPTLLEHSEYVRMYGGWEVLSASDSDLCETHPHNMVPHHHSLTRILARKLS